VTAPVALDPKVEQSCDFLQDVTKQVVTLATAVLTFTLTFLKDLATNATAESRVLITLAWIGLVVSTIFGLLVLLSMTGMLGRSGAILDIYSKPTRALSFLQLLFFVVSLGLALAFGATWESP